MRHWEAPQKADILVSELLGSFGDNELSPECLDGAQKFLKEGGISIPQSYTSFLQPITTAKLWNDVKVSTTHSMVWPWLYNLFEMWVPSGAQSGVACPNLIQLAVMHQNWIQSVYSRWVWVQPRQLVGSVVRAS